MLKQSAQTVDLEVVHRVVVPACKELLPSPQVKLWLSMLVEEAPEVLPEQQAAGTAVVTAKEHMAVAAVVPPIFVKVEVLLSTE